MKCMRTNSHCFIIFSVTLFILFNNVFEKNIPISSPEKKVRIFYTADNHDGVRMDFSTILSTLGQSVVLGAIKGDKLRYPTPSNVTIYTNLSAAVRNYKTHSTRLPQQWIQEHLDFYKNDPVIQKVDAFFCSFPASMCQLWKPFNKTIIFVPGHRYNLGRCSKEEWDELDNFLLELSKSENPKHVIAATTVYDAEYINYYTGLSPILLEMFGGFYTSTFQYNPTRLEIPIYGQKKNMSNFCPSNTTSLVPLQVFKPFKYESSPIESILRHPALVFHPYSTMAYKQAELYAVGMPMLVPSLQYYKTHPFGGDRTAASGVYCDKPDMALWPRHPSSHHKCHHCSPNMERDTPVQGIDREQLLQAELYWLQFGDFMTRPHLILFDNCSHLHYLLLNTDFRKVHDLMVEEVENRKKKLIEEWTKIIEII